MARTEAPAFLPWHREFLMQLEQELRTIEPGDVRPVLGLDTGREVLADPASALIWADDFMGPTGSSPT